MCMLYEHIICTRSTVDGVANAWYESSARATDWFTRVSLQKSHVHVLYYPTLAAARDDNSEGKESKGLG